MMQIALVGIGAGLAAALLFISPLGGTLLAFPLFVLSGLPIAIAGLAWGSLAAAIAAAAARPHHRRRDIRARPASIYLALFGAPMAWAAGSPGLSRTDEATGAAEWYPDRPRFSSTAPRQRRSA